MVSMLLTDDWGSYNFRYLTKLCMKFDKEIISIERKINLSHMRNLKHLEIVGSEANHDTKLILESSSNIEYLKLIGLVFDCIRYARRDSYHAEWVRLVDLKNLKEVHLENIVLDSQESRNSRVNSTESHINNPDLFDDGRYMLYDEDVYEPVYEGGEVYYAHVDIGRESIVDTIPEEATNLEKISFVGCLTSSDDSKFEIKHAIDYLSTYSIQE